MGEPPLSDRELRMVRGMIDDHEQRLERNRVLRDFWTTGRVIVVAVAAAMMFVLQFVAAVYSIRGH